MGEGQSRQEVLWLSPPLVPPRSQMKPVRTGMSWHLPSTGTVLHTLKFIMRLLWY